MDARVVPWSQPTQPVRDNESMLRYEFTSLLVCRCWTANPLSRGGQRDGKCILRLGLTATGPHVTEVWRLPMRRRSPI